MGDKEEKEKVDVSQGRWNLTADVFGQFFLRVRRLFVGLRAKRFFGSGGFRIWRFFDRMVVLWDGLLKDRIQI